MDTGENRSNDEEEKVLSPEELDIADDNRVVELEDGRYVVSSDDSGPAVSEDETTSRSRDRSAPERETAPPDRGREHGEVESSDPQPRGDGTELDEETVRRWLHAHVDGMKSQYGFHVTAKFDDATRQQQLVSNDVVTVFENLLMWYGQQLDSQTAVEEVLGILLLESNLTVQFPQQSLKAYLARNGLGPDDTIADLLETTEEGFAFPPPTG